MAIQPVIQLFVIMFVWPIHLVWKTDTNAQYVTVMSPPEQIHAYMENPQPHIRAVEWLFMYEILPWSIVLSLNVNSVDNKKQTNKKLMNGCWAFSGPSLFPFMWRAMINRKKILLIQEMRNWTKGTWLIQHSPCIIMASINKYSISEAGYSFV